MRGLAAVAASALLAIAHAAAAGTPFAVQAISLGAGRVVAADLVDLDGDARGDLVCISIAGMPPSEQRTLHVFYQQADRTFAAHADWSAPLPDGSAAYDLAQLDERPGAELILLRRDRLTLLSLVGRVPAFRDLPVPAGTIAVVADERGVDRLALARDGLADTPRLLVPGFGITTVLATSGEVLGRLEVGARANYYLPRRPGPLVSESEAQIYFDHPRLSVGDVDGDGRGDILSATRHELRLFTQDANGHFPERARRRIVLGLLTSEDHVRNSGTVRVDGADFDGDHRLDLLISHAVGSLFSASTTVAIHLNRGGGWNLEKPDQEFHAAAGLSGNAVIDLDGDGRLELIEARIPTGVLAVVEALVTRSIGVEVSIYRHAQSPPFDAKPWSRWQTDVPFSFETLRSRGFVPTLEADLDGDGIHDLLGSGAGDRIEVRRGRAAGGYGDVSASQPLDTGGRIRFGDLDGDGMTDFVLYDSRRPGTPVQVGVNRGVPRGVQPAKE